MTGGERAPLAERAMVTLFKSNGKYYTEELWEVPKGAIGPWDMESSVDFRRVDDGPIYVQSEHWGYPHLL